MKREGCKRSVNNFISVIVITLLVVLNVSVCSNDATAASSDSALDHIRVTIFPYLSFSPIFIAKNKGFFEEQGLDVEFVRFQTANSGALSALLTGQSDVGTIFTIGLLNAIGRGENARVVANKGVLSPENCPADGFLTRADLAEKLKNPSAEFLKTLTFGVDPYWLDSYFLSEALNEWGLNLDDITTKYVPNPAARAESIANGSLDIAFLSEPFITRVLDEGDVVMWKSAASIVPDFPLGVITFGPNLLEKDRDGDIGKRFIKGYLKGIATFNEGKTPENIEILANATKLDPELLKRICWPSFDQQGRINAAAVSKYSKWAVQRKLADRSVDISEFWDPRFIDMAAE